MKTKKDLSNTVIKLTQKDHSEIINQSVSLDGMQYSIKNLSKECGLENRKLWEMILKQFPEIKNYKVALGENDTLYIDEKIAK